MRLDPDDRALLVMRYGAGFDSTELAAATGRKPAAIRQRLKRLVDRLRRTSTTDDMTAFERQLSGEIAGLMGPAGSVDDLAVYESVTAASGRSPRWGFTLFSALEFIAASVIVALFGGFLMVGVFTTQQGDEVSPAAPSASLAPTGTHILTPSSGATTELVVDGDGVLWALEDARATRALHPGHGHHSRVDDR